MQESGPYDFLKQGHVPVAWREPFSEAPIYRQYNPAGETIQEIVLSIPQLPAEFLEHGVVRINAREVKREFWGKVRPLPDRAEQPIMLTLYLPPAGGRRGGGGKAILGLVASVALLFVTGGISAGLLATSGGWFAAGSISAKILAGAVGLVGALLLSALSAPPAAKKQPSDDENKEAASADGNAFDPGGPISCVIGTRKVYPNLIGDPIIDLIDQDEFLEAAYALNGPHKIEDIRESNTDIAEAEDLIYELREGWPDDAELTYVRRQGKMLTPQIQMSEHIIDQDNKQHLKTKSTALDAAVQNTDPNTKLPKWHSAATRRGPDEVWIHFLFGGGLGKQEVSEPFQTHAVPFRIRIKPRGTDTWMNLPEVHVGNKALKQFRYGIKLLWDQDQPDTQDASTGHGWIRAYNHAPAQTQDPATGGNWNAHPYFVGGGDSILWTLNYDTTGVLHTRLGSDNVEFYLDSTIFPRKIYDVEIKRGCCYKSSRLSFASYIFNAPDEADFIPDFFYFRGTEAPYKIVYDQDTLVSSCNWTRIISVWNQYPVQTKGLALIAVKALNRAVSRLSCIASRYVKDWDGTGWNTWTTTSNPAPHYADVLCGMQNLDPLPTDLRNDVALVDWRTRCIANDWTCDAIIEDMRTQDVLLLLASSAYARPYQSEQYGVTVDYDRAGVTPIQVFSQRNARDFRFEKAFARLPDGMIVNFTDQEADYDKSQVIVFRRGYSGGPGGIIETVSYDGLVDEAKVITRTQFDLDQAEQRSTFYYVTVGPAAIRTQRGDLVGLQNDVLTRRTGSAILKRILRADGDVIGFDLDVGIQVYNETDLHDIDDMHTLVDLHVVGLRTGIAIRREDDTISTHELADATGLRTTISLATPISDPETFLSLEETDGERASQVVSGNIGEEYRRAIVFGVAPQKDFEFQITLVDEAPGLLRLANHFVTDDTGTQMTDDDGTAMMDD